LHEGVADHRRYANEQLTVEPPSILTKAFDLLHAFNHKTA